MTMEGRTCSTRSHDSCGADPLVLGAGALAGLALRTGPIWRGTPPIQGSVALNDVLVEFTVGSIDGGVHSRQAIRHYSIDQDQVQRIDPLALNPRDFVDEWLTDDWRAAAFWSDSASRRSVRLCVR